MNFALPDWIGFSTGCLERYRRFGRLSVFSPNRMLCKFTEYLDEHDDESRGLLLQELQAILDEEYAMRKHWKREGLLNIVEMPQNTSYIDGRAMKYDDTRQCKVCKHVCFFSAVVCKCSSRTTLCLRHVTDICKCPVSAKCLLVWVTLHEIRQLIQKVKAYS